MINNDTIALMVDVDGKRHLVDVHGTLDTAMYECVSQHSMEGLAVLRHSTAHLTAQAICQLYPEAQLAIGPVTEDGFFYDVDVASPIKESDLAIIEACMHRLADEHLTITRRIMSKAEALQCFAHDRLKYDIIKNFSDHATVSVYRQGAFEDVCRGPHVPHTGYLQHFKLTAVSGVYWKGDASQPMLQRVYGTAFSTQEALQDYLARQLLLKERDHRRLGIVRNWFHFQEEAPGTVFWHPDGWQLYRLMEQYIRNRLQKNGYQEIKTPQLVSSQLWQKTGHLEHYQASMFLTDTEAHSYGLKPMSCPCHVLHFKNTLRSYRDLPLRFSEFGLCHRRELSGALHGLMRLRGFTQDDGHIFCTSEHIASEITALITLMQSVYHDFGFSNVSFGLSTRPKTFIGDLTTWHQAEQCLQQVLNDMGVTWRIHEGDGAFYGPKIDAYLQDALGRRWQCGTIQLDFMMPERLGATYVTSSGSKQTPVMIHRAIMGALERFLGIVIEHHAGKLPFWLSPMQIQVMPVSEHQEDSARQVFSALCDHGFRARYHAIGTLGSRIKTGKLAGIPCLIVIGQREIDTQTLSVTYQDTPSSVMTLQQFITSYASCSAYF
jgi:threonyl-tRNA synthetase